MIRRPPRSTRTDTLFPYTTLFRSRATCCCTASRRPASTVRRFAIPSCASLRRAPNGRFPSAPNRSEEHTSELQSLMRISYAVFCLKKKKKPTQKTNLQNETQCQNVNHNTINNQSDTPTKSQY